MSVSPATRVYRRRGARGIGYLWFYAVPGGDAFLEFDSSRGLDPVRRRLPGFAGTIQTDAYEVHESLSRKESAIARIGCLAHARRYLYKRSRKVSPRPSGLLPRSVRFTELKTRYGDFLPANVTTNAVSKPLKSGTA